MNRKETALFTVGIGSMGLVGFAWSAPQLSGATMAGGWLALLVATCSLVVLASGRVSA